MGTTLKKIIFEIGGGIQEGKHFKAVQIGGPSGGCLPESFLDMVDVARYFLDFTRRESCGQCIPCRIGTKRMFEILDNITKGRGRIEDIGSLLSLSETVKLGSLCGLGQSAPNPVLTTIRYFAKEYEAHIIDKRCPARICPM